MQHYQGGKRVFVKTYCIMLFAALIFTAFLPLKPANAQALDFINAIRTGDLSATEATQQIQENSQLTGSQANEFVNSILTNTGVTDETAATFVEGFLGENSPLSPEALSDVTQMMENFEQLGATPEAMLQTARDVVQERITSELGNLVTQIPGLGNIPVENIGNILQGAGILGELEDIATNLGAAAAADALERVTGLTLDPANLTESLREQVSVAIAEQIEALAPDLFNAIESLLGTGATATIVHALLGGDEPETLDPPDTELCSPSCNSSDQCGNCAPTIQNNHINIRNQINTEFEQQRRWVAYNFFNNYVQKALARMTLKLNATAVQQVFIIGTFFDAKHQLETQRLFQTLTAKAHKDYHPSQNLCTVGTNTRYLANSKRRSDFAKTVVADRMMKRQLNQTDGISYLNEESDIRSRVDDFIEKYCDPTGGGIDSDGNYSFASLCAGAGADRSQRNADINFTSTIENKLTLETDFIDAGASNTTQDEENIFALGANLFAHDTLPKIERLTIALANGTPQDIAYYYDDLRAMAAKRSVAQNSYAALTGLRAQGEQDAGPFLKAILAETGISEDSINQYLGDNPSYFAQEEVMMKLLYQNPTFYANLYDKPANVERMGTALLALEIIQDRNIYDSLLRSEATLATLVETLLQKEHRRVSANLGGLNLNKRRRGN